MMRPRLRACLSGLTRLPSLAAALATLVVLHGAAPLALAQDVHVLVVTGVSGDEEHATQFQKWAGAVVDSAKKHGVLAGNIAWLAEAPDKDPRISARSSRRMPRAASRCPAVVSLSTRVSPDRSSARLRVSETVRTAILTGRKGRVSSMRLITGLSS